MIIINYNYFFITVIIIIIIVTFRVASKAIAHISNLTWSFPLPEQQQQQ